jgi:hypothetical protein
MKAIELSDHELSVSDYSNFELNLMVKDGRILGTVKKSSTNGINCLHVFSPVIEFDETRCSERRIESVMKSYGFQRKVR